MILGSTNWKIDDIYLLRVDTEGNMLWDRTFGGNGQDVGCDIEIARNEGYIIGGFTFSYGSGLTDMFLLKVDSKGNGWIDE